MDEEKKLTRLELLAKARQVKAEKAKAKQSASANEATQIINQVNNEVNEKIKKKTKTKKEKPITEVKELKFEKPEPEPEIINEVIRVPANRRKKIVKRTIEIEESETDEEIVEEIVKIPKKKNEKKDEHKTDIPSGVNMTLDELNKARLLNELFSF